MADFLLNEEPLPPDPGSPHLSVPAAFLRSIPQRVKVGNRAHTVFTLRAPGPGILKHNSVSFKNFWIYQTIQTVLFVDHTVSKYQVIRQDGQRTGALELGFLVDSSSSSTQEAKGRGSGGQLELDKAEGSQGYTRPREKA